MDTGRKGTDQFQDSEKGRRKIEQESTKEFPTMMSNFFSKDLKQILINVWNC